MFIQLAALVNGDAILNILGHDEKILFTATVDRKWYLDKLQYFKDNPDKFNIYKEPIAEIYTMSEIIK